MSSLAIFLTGVVKVHTANQPISSETRRVAGSNPVASTPGA